MQTAVGRGANCRQSVCMQADTAQVAGLKDEGNKLFGRKEYSKAFDAYERALKMLPEGHTEAVLLHSNKAACSMMLKKFVSCSLIRMRCADPLGGDASHKGLQKQPP